MALPRKKHTCTYGARAGDCGGRCGSSQMRLFWQKSCIGREDGGFRAHPIETRHIELEFLSYQISERKRRLGDSGWIMFRGVPHDVINLVSDHTRHGAL